MDGSSREPLLRQAMDRLVHGVCEWKASAQPYSADRDVSLAQKDGLYELYRDSGLQPWEFQAVLHRALQYGMVEPQLQEVWSEVAATVLQQPYSEYARDAPEPQAWSHVSRSSVVTSNGGTYSDLWVPPNGRNSSAPVRPPGLDSKQPYANSAAALTAAGARSSPDADISCSSSDQRNCRKQQQAPTAGAKQPARTLAASRPAAAKPAVKQQQVFAAEGPGRGQPGPCSSFAEPAAHVAGSKSPPDLLPNGYIPAYRYDLPMSVGGGDPDAAPVAGQQQAKEAEGFAAGSTGTSSDQHQQQQQQQRGLQGAAVATASGWEVQEPLDLLPSGLLDDVYDQGDAVVDAPVSGGASLLSNPAATANHRSNGHVSRVPASRGAMPAAGEPSAVVAATGRSTSKQQQQQNSQQRQQKQSFAAAPAGDLSMQQRREPDHVGQQQQQPGSRPVSHDGSTAFGLPISPNGGILSGAMFSGQQQPGLDFSGNGPMATMLPRQSLDGAAQQQYGTTIQQQQQSLAYSPQQFAALGPATWGTGPMGSYMQPSFLGMAPVGAVQPPPPPPPPPRGHSAPPPAAAAAAGAAAGPTPVAAQGSTAAGTASAQPLNYAAVAAAAAAGHPIHRAQQHAAGDNCSNGQQGVRGSVGDTVDARPAAHQQHGLAAAHDLTSSESNEFGHQVPLYQPTAATGSAQQQQPPLPAIAAAVKEPSAGSSTEDAVVPPPVASAFGGLSLFHTASLDSPVTPAVGGPMSPYPSPLQRTLSASTGASPAVPAMGLAAASGSSVGSSSCLTGMAPMLLPPAAVPSLGAIGEPVGSLGSSSSRLAHYANGCQQQDGQVQSWSSFGPAMAPAAAAGDVAQQRMQQQQQQAQQTPVGSVGSAGTCRLVGTADGSTCSAESTGTAATASSVATPHSAHAVEVGNGIAAAAAAAVPAETAAGMRQPPPPPPPPPPRTSSLEDQQLGSDTSADTAKQQQQGSESPQQQQPAPPAKPMTWAQKLLTAKSNGSNAKQAAAAPAAAAAAGHARTAAAQGPHAAAGPRIAPAPLSETQQPSGAAAANSARRGGNTTTGQALLAAAKQQEAEAEAAAAAAVPSYSEAAALDGLDAVTAKAAVTAASRMPLPAKMIQAWRSGLCLASCIKLLQSQRSDLAMALNDRIKGWLSQDCDRSTAECLVLFVLTNLRRDWHVTAKSPGAFLMGLLQHRASLIGGSGMSRKLLEVARNFPNVAVYIDSDVLQELGDMEPSLRSFIMDEYMCKQRHDWPEGLKFPSQCLLSCMRSIRYADPAVHQAYITLMETRPDLSKAMNGVILYGLCKCDAATGLAAVKRLSELPAEWTSAARVNASAFLYQKVQELCGGHCY